jgi:D-sedoheptulose 7-phosphate isomerase
LASPYKPPAQTPSGGPVVSAEAYFSRLAELVPRLPYETIDAIAGALFQAVAEGHSIFVFGNGGSAASASHMMCDLNKGSITTEQTTPAPARPKVIALTDNVPLLTAWANDRGYEHVFSEQLKGLAQRGDVVLAISGSGNSPNVLLALKTAREFGAFRVGLAGFQGGRMKALCDLCAIVPSDNMQVIEDLHHATLHAIFTVVREKLRGSGRRAFTVTAGRSRR